MPENKIKKMYVDPKERVTQARLRLLAATKKGAQENPLLLPSKRANGIPAVALAFAAGFVAGFYPPILKSISQQAPSLIQRWFTRQINH